MKEKDILDDRKLLWRQVQKEAKELKISSETLLSLIMTRELKCIHYHIDEVLKQLGKK